MKRPAFIARQSACPSGLLGRLIARVMAAETAPANEEAVALLELQPRDRVLEVGFGHGRTLLRVASSVPEGSVAGIDLSAEMLRMARQRCATLIRAGRVDLREGDSAALPFPAAHFDKVYAVHTIYFWRPPEPHLREIHRVTKPGGRVVLGFTPKEDSHSEDFPASVYEFRSPAEVEALVRAAGFRDVTSVAGGTAQQRTVFCVAARE